jgi:hypothetical protein
MILMNKAFRIGTTHGIVLNFEFLLVLNHDDVTWDYPKMEDLGKRKKHFLHTQFGRSKDNCRYLVIKNHIFYF